MTRVPRIVAVLLVTCLATLLGAAPASAHAVLVRSSPAGGASVAGSPARVTLQFDEDVSGALSRVSVVGARTGAVETRIDQIGDAELGVALPRLPADLYRVEWHTVATDDLHATGGTFVFGVDTAAPVPASVITGTTAAGPAADEVALRWAEFSAVALVAGALAM
ncbi:MAG: copper transport protein, partial [Actinoplanes sp.]|nr:copper transport protein [Actinoplanes sp.]